RGVPAPRAPGGPAAGARHRGRPPPAAAALLITAIRPGGTARLNRCTAHAAAATRTGSPGRRPGWPPPAVPLALGRPARPLPHALGRPRRMIGRRWMTPPAAPGRMTLRHHPAAPPRDHGR